MTSLLDATQGVRLRGSEQPRVLSRPPYVTSSGDELADYAAVHGLVLDPWQRFCLQVAMAERVDGKWSAAEVGIVVPRQNGKGSILEARELGGLFLLGEELIVHTAHQFKTASEAFRRIRAVIDGSDELTRRVKRIHNSPADKGIELVNGNRLMFVARSTSSGRGFTADLVIFDEAYDLDQDSIDALVPTLTTIHNPQIWYTSSAGMAHSEVLADVRARGIAGGSASLAYLEYSAPDGSDPYDMEAVAQANPAYGIRIFDDFLRIEREALSPAGLVRERLGIWDPINGGSVFEAGVWDNLADPGSTIEGLVTFAVEVAEDRSWSAIAAVGANMLGLTHYEVIDYRPGTQWITERAVELAQNHPATGMVVQPNSPAGSLITDLNDAGVPLIEVSTQDYAQGCGLVYDAIVAGTVRHLGQNELNMSVQGAQKKNSSEAWVWNRRHPTLDISPLVAVTLAALIHNQLGGTGATAYVI